MIEWLSSFEDAKSRAQSKEKFILLDFFSPT